ncbi:MAG: DUF3267 domain-containing protein [Prolixibacteraceae bacterium]|nr:DUF3267 domain-containing protein [Prolixibacteraceae bacterium]MBN2775394.1 DUF3267 domain-containing protein [Prolixibacteraceae bacterium]
MKIIPSIHELNSSDKFELAKTLKHSEIKEFVISHLQNKSRIVRLYLFYQTGMVVLGVLIIGLSVIKAFNGIFTPLKYSLAALIFGFSVLIIIHELIHGAAYKFIGVKKVNYGAYWKKLMFYAEADQFVLNRNQFKILALAPLVVIKIVSVIGIIIFIASPAVYFFILLMCLHSLFCAGDIALLSFFYTQKEEMYTYDVKAEKTSYYFIAINQE